jgi:putative Mg2+ transporter-C (MgtC) family protein
MFVESGVVTLMGLLALTVLRRFEDKDDHVQRRRVIVTLGEHARDVTAIVEGLRKVGAKVSVIEYEKRLEDDKRRIVAIFDVQFADSIAIYQLIEAVETAPEVQRVIVRHQA